MPSIFELLKWKVNHPCLTIDIEEIHYLKSINSKFRFFNKGGECLLIHSCKFYYKELFLDIINSLDKNYDNMKLLIK